MILELRPWTGTRLRGNRYTPLTERLARGIAWPGNDVDCWDWMGSRNANGYGRIGVGDTVQLVHRVVFELYHGPIPPGLTLDHLCRNPPCCNPWSTHLEAVTHAENVRRGAATITHCPDGHEYTAENTYMTSKGSRGCRECKRVRARARYASYRAEQINTRALVRSTGRVAFPLVREDPGVLTPQWR